MDRLWKWELWRFSVVPMVDIVMTRRGELAVWDQGGGGGWGGGTRGGGRRRKPYAENDDERAGGSNDGTTGEGGMDGGKSSKGHPQLSNKPVTAAEEVVLFAVARCKGVWGHFLYSVRLREFFCLMNPLTTCNIVKLVKLQLTTFHKGAVCFS